MNTYSGHVANAIAQNYSDSPILDESDALNFITSRDFSEHIETFGSPSLFIESVETLMAVVIK